MTPTTLLLRFTPLLLCLFALPARAVIKLTDDTGAVVTLAAPAQRIISLAPHITEVLFAAGAGNRIVGTVEYSDYPEAAKTIRRVGGYSKVDLEAVAALKPDLVLGWQSGNASAHLDKLKALGLPLYVTQPDRIEDIARNIEQYGRLAGTTVVADAAARDFRARLAKLRARYEPRPPVRVFYQVWKSPLTTIGGKQIISDAIRLCGGVNIFADLAGLAPNVSAEAVLAANPEAIVASGMNDDRPEWLDDWQRWTQITAVARGNLFFIPPSIIQRHTPRLLDGAEQMCSHLETARGRQGK
jgi:iron complex transport system substrate-binding protein